MAAAMQWVSQITTISFSLALPPLGGYWLDNYFGTSPWLLIVGALFGMLAATLEFVALVRSMEKPKGTPKKKGEPPAPEAGGGRH
jgi:hypothetical protein